MKEASPPPTPPLLPSQLEGIKRAVSFDENPVSCVLPGSCPREQEAGKTHDTSADQGPSDQMHSPTQLNHSNGKICQRVKAMSTDINRFQVAFAALLDHLQSLQDECGIEGKHQKVAQAPSQASIHFEPSVSTTGCTTSLRNSSQGATSDTTAVNSTDQSNAAISALSCCPEESCPSPEESSTEDDRMYKDMNASMTSSQDACAWKSLPDLMVCPSYLQKRWSGTWARPPISSGSSVTLMRSTKSVFGKRDKNYKLDGLWIGLEILSTSMKEDEEAKEEEATAAEIDLQTQRSFLGRKGSLSWNGMKGGAINLMPKGFVESGFVLQPHSRASLIWGMAGMFLLFCDVITIPLMIGWDLDMEGPTLGMFFVAVLYWTLDILRNFFTGFFSQGEVVLSKSRIAAHYLRTWFIPDVIIVSVDFFQMASMGQDTGSEVKAVRTARSLRMLRLLRLVRVLKMTAQGVKLEATVGLAGVSGMILVVALVKTFSVIFVSAHVISCVWFYLGRLNFEAGNGSWLDIGKLQGKAVGDQYLHALHWVLCQFTPAPIDFGPGCSTERAFNILVIGFSLLVMGSSIQKVTQTIKEINTMNSEKQRKRLEIRQYMFENDIPITLSSRIMCFANHSLQNQCRVALDSALISEALQKELTMFQRATGLCVHPLLKLLSDVFEHVFCDICGATTHALYGKDELVFEAGSVGEGLVVTMSGEYRLQFDTSASALEPISFKEPAWFAEIGVFCRMLHCSTLLAESFGGIFKLAGADLAQCAKKSPRCGLLICEYARALLHNYMRSCDVFSMGPDLIPQEVSVDATKATTLHKEMYVRTKHIGSIISLPDESYVSQLSVHNFFKLVFEGQVDDTDIVQALPSIFSELNMTTGVFAQLDQSQERNCGITSILSVIWLLTDQYQNFVAHQQAKDRLTLKQWSDLQQFVKWANLSLDQLVAALTFLAIRGLGKVSALTTQLPSDQQGPERAVLHLIDKAPNVVPSAIRVGEEMRNMIRTCLDIHCTFNLGQMIQGENTPCSVKQLQDSAEEHGEEALRLYLFSLIGIFCGIAADATTRGSRFMNEKNARTTLLCMSALQHLSGTMPQEIYWSYILSRSRFFNLEVSSPQETALIRLVCLNRAHEQSEVTLVNDAWNGLAASDRQCLTEHLLRDGIAERTFLFQQLPLCFANARANSSVGLSSALVVIAELIEMMTQKAGTESPMCMTVDLTDLALFFSIVKSNAVLLTCIMQSKLVESGGSTALKMSFSQVSAVDGQDFDISNGLIRIMRNQQAMANTLTNLKGELNQIRGVRASAWE